MMLRSVKDLHGYVVHAMDGDIGRARALLFDDQTWAIRYLVCDLGIWLPGRRVLIAPVALGQPYYETHMFPVSLTKEQVKNSPDIDTDKPVARQQELALHRYYEWPVYWEAVGPVGSAPIPIPPPAIEAAEVLAGQEGNPHLQSTQDVIGYYIQASDGDIGHVEDFIVDDAAWIMRYMVIDTRNWWPGKKVLVAPQWIATINWGEAQVHVDLRREDIENSPEFDPAEPVNREYEERLYDFYGRPKYWL